MAFLGTLFLAGDLLLAGGARRAEQVMNLEIAQQNALAAIRWARDTLAAETADGTYVTAPAEMVAPAAPPVATHWVSLWSVKDGKADFSRWLVSAQDESAEEIAFIADFSETSPVIFPDYGLPDRFPTVKICSRERLQGHLGFWIGDESAKVRINLLEPEISVPAIAQNFGRRWLQARGLEDDEAIATLATKCTFEDLRRAICDLVPENFHMVTLCSEGVLQNTSGKFPVDLTVKLRRREFSENEFLFPPNPKWPQAPPTFSLLASYLDGAKHLTAGNLPVRSGGPHCRQLYPPSNQCVGDLAALPLPEFGFYIANSYGFHPVLCGCWLTVSAKATEQWLTLTVTPQIALWNPLSVGLDGHDYAFEWRVTEVEERLHSPPGLPCLVYVPEGGGEAKIFLGDVTTGTIFKGNFHGAFAAGEVKIFSLKTSAMATGGALQGNFHCGDSVNDWYWEVFSEGQSSLSIKRFNGIGSNARWNNMTLRLLDGVDGHWLQEVADFVDDDVTVEYFLPRDGKEHSLFRISASIRAGTGPNPTRWLADYNPRAPQIRRSAYEHFAPFGFLGSERKLFLRTFPSWSVSIDDLSGEISPAHPKFFPGGNPSAILFDVPADIWSIATLQHLQLLPFSYHPASAVGNGWAPPLLPRDKTWVSIEPSASIQKNCDYFRGEMRLDASYLLNEFLYDNVFISGLEMEGPGYRFFSHCRPLEGFSKDLSAEDSSRFLCNGGALNINGASAEAWKIFLRSMPYDADSGTYFLPRFSGQRGSGVPQQRLRKLTELELDRLAECIAGEVQAVGPFASLSQFVNRRLGSRDDPTTRCAALQRAIERAKLRNFSPVESNDRRKREWFDDGATVGDANSGAPGDIDQADLLQFFGNSLTVRGDTFLVRGYGDAATGKRGADPTSAIGEMLLQRMPDGSLREIYFRWIHS
ncbi:MAG: hypothetical protein LBS68_02775 [Puniceicoccales bacterium]|jgi:hypothetical protein|nr:hypothetical protein [Puniceicoccales bacterium]